MAGSLQALRCLVAQDDDGFASALFLWAADGFLADLIASRPWLISPVQRLNPSGVL
jgi:hypothetical protein